MHSDVNTRLYMGYCLMHLDRPAEAEKIYEELVAEGMHHATVYFSLAAAEKALGKRTEARSNLELFMKSATPEQQSLMLEAKQMLEDLSK
jgi:predicted Zn-dependent protease